jgi:fibronectin type 3 domain-containing protein
VKEQEIESDYDELGIIRQAVKGNKTKIPKMLTIAQKEDTVEVTWEEVPEADGYIVIRKVDGGEYKREKRIKDADKTTYIDKKVSSGHVYNYTVRAFKYIERDVSVDSEYDKPGIELQFLDKPGDKK